MGYSMGVCMLFINQTQLSLAVVNADDMVSGTAGNGLPFQKAATSSALRSSLGKGMVGWRKSYHMFPLLWDI